ncbi:hypothetical protein N7519_011027 [Penicillium mononematosum]|uniref:uncharacterized protein n=1 Tax=Penicillium mononematosum TaxID=268346 RepID=UPI0025485705|nr:uncharacterized protein N7519_011027 [Penicillium mononematosum]KAJ6180566.1 hypothetical protein N7519_011027 [Penicillium mononematosum]
MAVRMKMSRLLNDIGESLKDQEHLAQDAQQSTRKALPTKGSPTTDGLSPSKASRILAMPTHNLGTPQFTVHRATSPTLPLLVPRLEASPSTTPSQESELKVYAKRYPEPSQLPDVGPQAVQSTIARHVRNVGRPRADGTGAQRTDDWGRSGLITPNEKDMIDGGFGTTLTLTDSPLTKPICVHSSNHPSWVEPQNGTKLSDEDVYLASKH